jgi:hypothetical protein
MASDKPVPIAQAFRMVRMGGRRDIYLHAEDVLIFLERTKDIQGLPEAKGLIESMQGVVASAYHQAIERADG